MPVRYLLLALSLFVSALCLAQQPYQLDKQQKKELKKLQKEGWMPTDPASDLAQQYSLWRQKEAEQRPDGTDRYTVAFSEVEDASLQIAERRAWGDACTSLRRLEATKVGAKAKVKEYTDRNGKENSETSLSQVGEMNYSGSMKDIDKVFSIYRKAGKGYAVRVVAAKENK